VSQESSGSDPMAAFGPNEWLVDELYQRYQEDKNSVDKAWWQFFADYTPSNGRSPAVEAAASGPADTAPRSPQVADGVRPASAQPREESRQQPPAPAAAPTPTPVASTPAPPSTPAPAPVPRPAQAAAAPARAASGPAAPTSISCLRSVVDWRMPMTAPSVPSPSGNGMKYGSDASTP